MDDLLVTPTAVEACHYSVAITVPAAQVQTVYKQTVKEFINHAQVPGFRPGKSPLAMIKRRFAARITEMATQQLVEEAVRGALGKVTVKPVTMPTLVGDRDKLRASFLLALRKRPVSADAVDTAIGRVEQMLLQSGARELPSTQIGAWVMEEACAQTRAGFTTTGQPPARHRPTKLPVCGRRCPRYRSSPCSRHESPCRCLGLSRRASH